MKPRRREMASMALLAALLTGCSNVHVPFHQQAQAPPLQNGKGSLEARENKLHQPPPPLPPLLAQAAPPTLPPSKQEKVKRGKRSRRKETSEPESATQEASNNAPAALAATSAIGPLIAGGSATEAQTKRDTETLIAQTEHGLAAIKHSLSKDEKTTAGQIHTFLQQAKQALQNGDSDGAYTLATKAKLLLDELTKQ